jgi:hypothetical protein
VNAGACQGFLQADILILVLDSSLWESTGNWKVRNEDIRTHCG